jgi:hypothetical protein
MIMKKIYVVLFMLGTLFLSAQSIFDAYANNEEVSYVSISPKMFQMLGKMSVSSSDPEAAEFLKMVQSIRNFKVLVSANAAISDEMMEWVTQQVLEKKLEELMTVKDVDSDIHFYVKESGQEDLVEQLLMFAFDKTGGASAPVVRGKKVESVLMLLEGAIDLNQISKLTEKMDLPGGEQLKMAGKNN